MHGENEDIRLWGADRTTFENDMSKQKALWNKIWNDTHRCNIKCVVK